MNILLTGGTGLIGKHLAKLLLKKGYTVTILSRGNIKESSGVKFAHWDPAKGEIDNNAVKSADHIIHLAGENVAEKRWTKKRKQQILKSRTESSALIIKALKETDHRVRSIISASAIGWYGPDTDTSMQNGFKEEAAHYPDFLGETCVAWENSIQPAEIFSERLVILRTGIVFAKEGGALKEFIKPLNGGVATILGSGKQVISWIHIDDICRLYLYAIENEDLRGVYNAVAPHPVSNKELVLELAKQKRGQFFIPVHIPSFVLKLMLGEMSVEVLKSATVNDEKIKKAGFHFMYPGLNAAIEQIVKD